MPRSLVFLIIILIALIAAMFFLASMDIEQPAEPVEMPVIGGELN